MPNLATPATSGMVRFLRSRRGRIVGSLAIAGAVAAAAVAFASMRPLTLPVARTERSVPLQVYGLGTVEARILSDVGFEVAAALAELHADHGDRVPKGKILARLHSAEQEAKVAKAKAGLLNAEAALVSAEAAVAKSKAILAQKEVTNKRRQALLGRQVTSAEAAGESEKEEIVARADVAATEANIAVAKAQIEDAKAQLRFDQVLLEHHVLASPYDALVVKRHREIGAVLKAGETLFTLIDPASVWALAFIDEARAGAIRLEHPAQVKLRSRPQDAFPARVVRIGIESDRVSEERRVYVACEVCPDSIHLGEQIEVFITTSVLDQALLLPEHAIESFDGASGKVWTIEKGRLQKRVAKFGARTLDGRVQVLDGLPPDASLVTAPPKDARLGRAARPANGAAR